MPELPTLTVSDAQAARLMAAFGSVVDYKAWLRRQLVDHVTRYEMATINAETDALRRQRLEEVATAVLEETP